MHERAARGFSFGELASAGVPLNAAKREGLSLDIRRRSVVEGNVEMLKGWFKSPPRSPRRRGGEGRRPGRRARRSSYYELALPGVVEEVLLRVSGVLSEVLPHRGRDLLVCAAREPRRVGDVGVQPLCDLLVEEPRVVPGRGPAPSRRRWGTRSPCRRRRAGRSPRPSSLSRGASSPRGAARSARPWPARSPGASAPQGRRSPS